MILLPFPLELPNPHMEASKAHCPPPVRFHSGRGSAVILLSFCYLPSPSAPVLQVQTYLACKGRITGLLRHGAFPTHPKWGNVRPSPELLSLPRARALRIPQEVHLQALLGWDDRARTTRVKCTGQRTPAALQPEQRPRPSGHLLIHPKTSRAGFTEEANLDPSESDGR